ncbi:MAG: hypothetical protein PHH71_03590, partial [Clostridia bacterium]|nr:hypothetical protein [Clostridia bacterium]MDD3862425.1 hypothetical protein [Clostridia bacterium]
YLQIIFFVVVTVFNIIVAIIITNAVSDGSTGSGSLDGTFVIWMIIIGLTFFASSFKVALLSGMSRKTYFLSSIITLTAFSFVMSIIGSLFILLAENVSNTFTLYTMMYGKNILGLFVWMFSSGFLMATLGWFIISIFYRTSKKQRLVICAFLLLIPSIFILINMLTNGAVGNFLSTILLNIIGFGGVVPNPYIASISMLILSLILCAGTFFLLRRAELKE